MNRRIVYKEQAKCNFCYNWFQVFSQIKFGLNICQACIYKALNTSCFKLPTPQGHLYQVYLARRNISLNINNQSQLLEKIDQFMHAQIRQLLDKWQEVTKILKSFNTSQCQDQIWKKVQSILKNDAKIFTSFNNQTFQQIRQDIIEREKTQRKILCTPMKQKNMNMSIKLYNNNKSNKKLNRIDSKKSIRTFRDINDKSATKVTPNQQQNYNQEQHRKNQTSPFSLGHLKRIGNSTRNLLHVQNGQNREFIAKVKLIKNNITSCLQERGQISIQQPIGILKEKIYEAILNTNCINKCIELVSYNGLTGIDLKCYLSNLDWQGIEVVKFVKVGLTDQQLEIILDFIKDKAVQTLVLTSNNLTQQSCKNLLQAEIKSLRNIYLGKNQIFAHKIKNQVKELKSKYNFFL